MVLTDQEILKLYYNKDFMGSFSGMRNLKKWIFTDYGEDISLNRLYTIFKQTPDYVQNLRPVHNFPTRHYQVDSFGKLLEMDLGFMKAFNVSLNFNFNLNEIVMNYYFLSYFKLNYF